MSSGDLLAVLHKGLTELGEDPASHPCQSYLDYLALLAEWNRAYNLTAVRGVLNLLTHHVLDSLAVLPYIHGVDCLDIGSGAGLPGLVLALARPQQHWQLLDSNGKKVRFLKQAILTLALDNVRVIQARVEDFHPADRFSTVICRALLPAAEFYRQVSPLLQGKGRVLVMKGKRPAAELADLRAAGIGFDLAVLRIPGLNKQRHLVVLDVA